MFSVLRRTHPVLIAAVLVTGVALIGCGGSTMTVTATSTGQSQSTTSAAAAAASAANDQVINQAAQGGDNQAELGAAAIRRILTNRLG